MGKKEAIIFGAIMFFIFIIIPTIVLLIIEDNKWNKNNIMTRHVYCGNFLNEKGIDPEPNRWDDTLWYERNGKDYCNNIEVEMKCYISNSGSACYVKDV